MNNEMTTATPLIVVEQLPVIRQRLEAISVKIDTQVAYAMSMACTEDTYKTVKDTRAMLNKEFATLDAERKAVKKAVLAPYEQFEDDFKRLVADKYRGADTELKRKIEEVEQGLKDAKAEGVKAYFVEYAQSLSLEWVPFERSGIKVNLTVSDKKLREQAKAFLDGINDDIQIINGLDDQDAILAEYADSLNLNGAIATVRARRAAEERRRQEREARERSVAEQRMRDGEAVQLTIDDHPLSAPSVESPSGDKSAIPKKDETDTQASTQKLVRVKFSVTDTIERIRDLKRFLVSNGYKFEQ